MQNAGASAQANNQIWMGMAGDSKGELGPCGMQPS